MSDLNTEEARKNCGILTALVKKRTYLLDDAEVKLLAEPDSYDKLTKVRKIWDTLEARETAKARAEQLEAERLERERIAEIAAKEQARRDLKEANAVKLRRAMREREERIREVQKKQLEDAKRLKEAQERDKIEREKARVAKAEADAKAAKAAREAKRIVDRKIHDEELRAILETVRETSMEGWSGYSIMTARNIIKAIEKGYGPLWDAGYNQPILWAIKDQWRSVVRFEKERGDETEG